jgi:hypothetical protein
LLCGWWQREVPATLVLVCVVCLFFVERREERNEAISINPGAVHDAKRLVCCVDGDREKCQRLSSWCVWFVCFLWKEGKRGMKPSRSTLAQCTMQSDLFAVWMVTERSASDSRLGVCGLFVFCGKKGREEWSHLDQPWRSVWYKATCLFCRCWQREVPKNSRRSMNVVRKSHCSSAPPQPIARNDVAWSGPKWLPLFLRYSHPVAWNGHAFMPEVTRIVPPLLPNNIPGKVLVSWLWWSVSWLIWRRKRLIVVMCIERFGIYYDGWC